MEKTYKVILTAKNEGIEYIDNTGVYRFDVCLRGHEWIIFIPGTKGDDYKQHQLSNEEMDRIIPRITGYLKKIKWCIFFKKNYSVSIESKITDLK